MRLDIYFRSCSRVYAVHGNRRIVNSSKSEIILRCLTSLVRSIERATGDSSTPVSLTVIDDHSEPECIRGIQKILNSCSFKNSFISMETTGNGASLKRCYEAARDEAESLIYFVEDDYLHAKTAIQDLLGAYQQISFFLKQDVVLFPCDYPNLYLRHYPSAIVLSESRYWRNVGHTTATIFLSRKTLIDHWERYMEMTHYVPGGEICEDNTINLVYQHVPCFSPMPTLAIHVADSGTISPFVDWTQWWNENEVPGFHSDRPPLFSD